MSTNTEVTASADPEELLNRHRLRKKVPVSDMTIWRWQRAGTFPKPIWINGRRYWRASEIAAWIDDQA